MFIPRLASKHKAQHRTTLTEQTKTLKTYTPVVNYLLHTYATDKIVEDTEDEIPTFIQPQNKKTSQYEEELVAKRSDAKTYMRNTV